jgi:hypothetical protein
MKTAVEWLIKSHFGAIENCTPDFRNKIEQAKEMEKVEKLKYQLFIGKVSEIIGDQKTFELLKECQETIK